MTLFEDFPSYLASCALDDAERRLYLLVFLLMETDVPTIVKLSRRMGSVLRRASRQEVVVEMLRRLAEHRLIRFVDAKQLVSCIPPPLDAQRELFAHPATPGFLAAIKDNLRESYYNVFSLRCLWLRTASDDIPYSALQQALLLDDVAGCEKLIRRHDFGRNPVGWHRFVSPLVTQIIASPREVTPKVFLYLFPDIAEHLITAAVPAAPFTEMLEEQIQRNGKLSDVEFLAICAWLTWTGSHDALVRFGARTHGEIHRQAVEACLLLLKGDFDRADKAFGKVLVKTGFANVSWRRMSYANAEQFCCEVDPCGTFFTLALLASLRARSSATRTRRLSDKLMANYSGESFASRMAVDFERLIVLSEGGILSNDLRAPSCIALLGTFVHALETLFLEDSQVHPDVRSGSLTLLKTACDVGYGFMAASLIPCMQRLYPDNIEALTLCDAARLKYPVAPVWDRSFIVTAWERALGEIERMLPGSAKGREGSSEAAHLLKWTVVFRVVNAKDIELSSFEARLLKRLKSGKWSSGAEVRLDKLVHGDYDDKLDDHDKRIKQAIQSFGGKHLYYYGNKLDAEEAEMILPTLVGHPRVYAYVYEGMSSTKGEEVGPVTFVKGEVSLEIKTASNGDTIVGIPWLSNGRLRTFQVVRDRPDRFVFYAVNALQTKLANVVMQYGKGGNLVVPAAAASRFQSLLPSLAREVGVKGDFDTDAVDARSIEGGVHLLLRGRFVNGALHLELLNKPVEALPLFVTPGVGMRKTLVRHDEEIVAVSRDLVAERKALDKFLAACPSLADWSAAPGRWEVESLSSILAALDECHALADRIPLEWPEKDGLDIVRPRTGSAFSLTGEAGSDFWLSIGGDLALDDDRVLTFGDLLAAVGNRTEGFVRLSETRYLRLTKKLAAELELLSKAGEVSDEGLRVPPSALPLLESMASESDGLDFPALVRSRIDEFRVALDRRIDPPSSLTCELRPYQREGFAWLAKLAACGLGACLADDMGLGKTIQILALLAHRGDQGPSLVVAPTSVSRNWQAEAARYAPALNVVLLADAEDRAERVREAGPFDVVVCSYGLLLFEEELLGGKAWNVVVLDEAQAVKNRLAKRACAVKQLRSAMRVIATGTPVENNLGELWSLFDFLNPGLLGTHGQFERRFCNSDGSVSPLLKKMTAPFILRRLKSEVLDDLPPKTEISLEVVLDDEERALYESCRREALTSLKAGDGEQNRIVMLAHLMRLRRACCHPSLVLPDCALPGQKVEAFMELVSDLKPGGHRALVFSQFVDFLSIIRARLDRESIPYQYLDGSTSLRKRTEAVERFQRGEGDFFLISMKAGGTGLNLTAANYVILLDPWWNPAVEMQAADRAHRIGQKHPVTIYRLVTADTVEARVVELHARKRALAEAVLEDTGDTRLSVADLATLFMNPEARE